MSINLKKGISVLAVSSLLFVIGCGSGGGTSETSESSDSSRDGIGGTSGVFKYDRVSIAGSSITYGGAGEQGGYLGEKSYMGDVMSYLMESVADTIGPDELGGIAITEPYSYKGKLKKYTAGEKVEGTLRASDEIIIVSGGSDAVVEMEVDGHVCGSATIGTGFKPVLVEYPNNPKAVDPSAGIEVLKSFRQTNEKSVSKICTNLENKEHQFTLTVKSGELHLNFITNHMYYFQNAGIGGYRASDLLKEKAAVQNTTTDQIVAFNPDLFILESSTNDAEPWGLEDDKSTNNWKIDNPETCTIANNIVSGLNTAGIAKGDVVVIGEYNGDMKNMAVGIVSDIKGDDIELEKSVVNYGNASVSGQTLCRVKEISAWVDDVTNVVDRVKNGVGSHLVVGIGTSGVPNYYNPNYEIYKQYKGKARRLLGYREVGQNLAVEKGWKFFDFFTETLKVNSGVEGKYDDENGIEIDNRKWSVGDNTHPSEKGFPIFAKAITDKL